MKKHALVLLMAGSSSRFGVKEPKQFLDLGGQPMYRQSLKQFIKCGFDQICLVCPKSYIAKIQTQYTLVVGGKSRQESSFLGLKALDQDIELVTIHDAARALVPLELIQQHKEEAQNYQAITTVMPVNDTIYQVQNTGHVTTLNRESLRLGQTPQTFDRNLLEKGHKEFTGQATDDAMIIESLGHRLHLIEGSPDNFKITYKRDLNLARLILSQTST